MIKELKKKQLKLLSRYFCLSRDIENINKGIKGNYILDSQEIKDLRFTKKIFKDTIKSISNKLKDIKYQIRNRNREFDKNIVPKYITDYENRFGSFPRNRITRKRIDEFYLKYYKE